MPDYDQMIELEEAMIETLGDSAIVDGHDMGSGECNIFIYADHPEQTFASLQRLLNDGDWLPSARAAFRPTGVDAFKVIWPRSLTHFSIG